MKLTITEDGNPDGSGLRSSHSMSAVALDEKQTELNRALEAAIDPWLEHMRWRSDFAQWREGRLWQDRKQANTLNHLRSFLRLQSGAATRSDEAATDNLAGRRVLDLGSGMGGLAT